MPSSVLLPAAQPIGSLPLEQLQTAVQSGPSGLSQAEAVRRLEHWGANRLPAARRRPLGLRLLDQMLHVMALLLWVAGALAFAAGTPQLGWAIWAVVLINGLFSFWQEFQAERTLGALTRALPRQVQVWRDGELRCLEADGLVPGDRILLEEGDRIPADARLCAAHALYIDLSVLTGESLPAARQAEPPAAPAATGVPSHECPTLVLAGCSVASGRGEAYVYATGAETEFGQVAHLAAGTQRTPSTLEHQVGRIVQTITVLSLSMAALAFALSLLFVGMGPLESLVFAIGILVANVPEGLLPTVTLALALNVQRMARRRALVRRLSAVETLGSVSVICSDKTGTLTGNRMQVEQTWLPGVPEAGAREAGAAEAGGAETGAPALTRLLLRAASLCSNARLEHTETPGEAWRAIGDPTENGLLLAALAAGLEPQDQQGRHPRRREIPFDSHRRRMSVLVDWRSGEDDLPLSLADGLVLTKGAPLEVLAHCSGCLTPSGLAALDDPGRRRVVAANDDLARQGFRVIAVAVRPAPAGAATAAPETLEGDQALVGLVALYDPPRPEVAEAVRQCRQAGIKVTMVTGDYGLTAEAIARQIGLLDPPGSGHAAMADPVRVIDGASLAQIGEVQLRQLLKYRHRLVFARMAPEQKLRLVRAYRDLGEVVAVTGDGVNDAPALRAADVGVAMGLSGTDVAREAADIVLLDDNFATIVEAVRCGRSVVANIGRFITYVLASNVGEVAPFLAMVAFRIPAALTVLQILAVDLGTDLLPALGLGAEPPEAGGMHQPPRRRHQPLLDRGVMVRAYLVLGLAEAIASLGGYLLVWRWHGVGWAELRALAPDLLHRSAPAAVQQIQAQASTVAFALIVAGQMGALLACRSDRQPFWATWRRPNRLLWAGFVSEPLVAGLLILVPALAGAFGNARFPVSWLPPMLLSPLLVLLADMLGKRWRACGVK